MNQYPPDPWQGQAPYNSNPGNAFPQAGNYPLQQPQYGYSSNNTAPYNMPYTQNQWNPAYPAPANQWNPAISPKTQKRPFLLTLLIFPFICLKVFLLPSTTTFALEKDQGSWRFLAMFLLLMGVFGYWLSSLYGRIPQLTPIIKTVSLGHIIPQAFANGDCVWIGLCTPVVYLLLIWSMRFMAQRQGAPKGKATFQAQSYTTSLIVTPIIVVSLALAYVSLYIHQLTPTLRLGIGGIELLILGYGFILQMLAVMAVQGLSASKAAFVVSTAVIILMVVIALAALFLMAMSGESSSNGGGGSSRNNSGSNKSSSDRHSSGNLSDNSSGGGNGNQRHHRQRMMIMSCPNCGGWNQHSSFGRAMSCPNCGLPMVPYQP